MMDPEAAHIVFESVKDHVITVLPWETCIDGDMNLEMVTIDNDLFSPVVFLTTFLQK